MYSGMTETVESRIRGEKRRIVEMAVRRHLGIFNAPGEGGWVHLKGIAMSGLCRKRCWEGPFWHEWT